MNKYPLIKVDRYKGYVIPLWDVMKNLGVIELHRLGIRGQGISIAILDSGGIHPFFENNIIDTFSVVPGEDVVDTLDSHGAIMAGIIGGRSRRATYERRSYRMIGAAPKADLIIGKCLEDHGEVISTRVLEAIDISVEKGADIISLSLGARWDTPPRTIINDKINQLAREDILFVLSAGNQGPKPGTINRIGDAQGAITVGSNSMWGWVSSFSSRGPTQDGRIKPDIVSFGGDKRVETNIGPVDEVILSSGVEDEYWVPSWGTSLATASVAGILALLLQAGMTPDRDIAEKVLAEGVQICRRPSVKTPDDGWGLVDAYGSYQYLIENKKPLEI